MEYLVTLTEKSTKELAWIQDKAWECFLSDTTVCYPKVMTSVLFDETDDYFSSIHILKSTQSITVGFVSLKPSLCQHVS